jgi:hypothetical protein
MQWRSADLTSQTLWHKIDLSRCKQRASPGGNSVKGPVTAVTILVLSLAVWTAFYLDGLPLDLGSTTIVVGAIAILVMLVNLGVRRFRKTPQAEQK